MSTPPTRVVTVERFNDRGNPVAEDMPVRNKPTQLSKKPIHIIGEADQGDSVEVRIIEDRGDYYKAVIAAHTNIIRTGTPENKASGNAASGPNQRTPPHGKTATETDSGNESESGYLGELSREDLIITEEQQSKTREGAEDIDMSEKMKEISERHD